MSSHMFKIQGPKTIFDTVGNELAGLKVDLGLSLALAMYIAA